jgi:diguanylate cyclase (GGDEF)-like protein
MILPVQRGREEETMDKHIEFLAGAVDEILSRRDHLETLHQILFRLKTVMPVSAAALVLAVSVTESLSIVCQHNVSVPTQSALKEAIKPAIISRIFYRDRFLVVSSDDELSEFKEIQLEEVCHEAVLIRVSDKNRAVGFLILFFKEVIAVDAVTRNFLIVFAGLVSLAIENKERPAEEASIPAMICSETRLLTYSSFFQHLEREVDRTTRLGLSLSITLMDIGNFRSTLSLHGRETAIQLVRDVARLIRETLRKKDVAGIYGADEFAIFLPDTAKEEAERICRLCAERVAAEVFTDKRIASSLIVGIAHFAKGEKAGELLFKMQKAYYQARVSEDRLHVWGN